MTKKQVHVILLELEVETWHVRRLWSVDDWKSISRNSIGIEKTEIFHITSQNPRKILILIALRCKYLVHIFKKVYILALYSSIFCVCN